ncbi:GSCFA domain-containing protein [Algoriphagus hitonicola]|uniref:GSCFA family protein n=1 Tax=Algoriphagus hitonicola TaxID=435880 RepID=A0A1I2SV16_9BACT|nr:GSCFA domain-containing protein [Algoriphagus hitonicola]SFG56674.1 GSCFA family protein [Algoriphagus hitonicola]
MNWFTSFEIPPADFPISHQSKILSMGSCFAQVIGQKMLESKFDVLINPFGTIFHPSILAKLLDHTLFQDPLEPSGILQREGLFFHYAVHSDLNGKSALELEEKWNQQIQKTHEYFKKSSHLILTFGTAWIYDHQDFGSVANCHKQPQKLFQKNLSSLEGMTFDLAKVLDNFSRVFPQLNIILTVSPVRHIKDGIPENQLSKSLLRVLCHELEKKFESVSYFPSYEIMMDELRDYRFYKEDRIHPTDEAENYIWERFSSTFFSKETREKVSEIEKIQRELGHRPLNPESDAHRKFLQNLLIKLERMSTEFDFSNEIKKIKTTLNERENPFDSVHGDTD